VVGLATLGQCHHRSGINRQERTSLGYSQMLGHRLRVKFGGGMKH